MPSGLTLIKAIFAVDVKSAVTLIAGIIIFAEIMVCLRSGARPLNSLTNRVLNPEICIFDVFITKFSGKLEPLERSTHSPAGEYGSSCGIPNSGYSNSNLKFKIKKIN